MKTRPPSVPINMSLHKACEIGDEVSCAVLIDKRVDVNEKDKEHGRTALHYAALSGSVDCAALLLEYGAITDARDSSGYTPLHASAMTGQSRVATVLIREGADVNDARNRNGRTPLHTASASGAVECASFLIECGGNLGAKDHNGYTPLHAAVFAGQPACVALLLDHDSMVEAQDNFGDTPLHLAARSGEAECAQLIVGKVMEKAQDSRLLEIKNNYGRTPVDLATQKGHQEIKTLLATGMSLIASRPPVSDTVPTTASQTPDEVRPQPPATKQALEDAVRSASPRSYRNFGADYAVDNSAAFPRTVTPQFVKDLPSNEGRSIGEREIIEVRAVRKSFAVDGRDPNSAHQISTAQGDQRDVRRMDAQQRRRQSSYVRDQSFERETEHTAAKARRSTLAGVAELRSTSTSPREAYDYGTRDAADGARSNNESPHLSTDKQPASRERDHFSERGFTLGEGERSGMRQRVIGEQGSVEQRSYDDGVRSVSPSSRTTSAKRLAAANHERWGAERAISPRLLPQPSKGVGNHSPRIFTKARNEDLPLPAPTILPRHSTPAHTQPDSPTLYRPPSAQAVTAVSSKDVEQQALFWENEAEKYRERCLSLEDELKLKDAEMSRLRQSTPSGFDMRSLTSFTRVNGTQELNAKIAFLQKELDATKQANNTLKQHAQRDKDLAQRLDMAITNLKEMKDAELAALHNALRDAEDKVKDLQSELARYRGTAPSAPPPHSAANAPSRPSSAVAEPRSSHPRSFSNDVQSQPPLSTRAGSAASRPTASSMERDRDREPPARVRQAERQMSPY